jgi:site-specific recombinase XerC
MLVPDNRWEAHHVRCVGKGRKERCTPLTQQTRAILKAWLSEPGRDDSDAVFPAARGGHLSAGGVQYLLAKHVAAAQQICPSLRDKSVSPHVLRHYLPFLTMSCSASTSHGTTGVC